MQEVRGILWARRAATHEGKAAASQSEEEEQWLEEGNKQLIGGGACAEEDGRASSSGLGSNCPPSMSRGGPGDVRVAYMHMHGQCSLLKEEKSS